MARITEFQAPEGLGIRPAETGIEATARAARQLGYAYSQAAQSKAIAGEAQGSAIEAGLSVALKYAEHKEIADGSAAWASLVNGKTAEWDKINKNGSVHDGAAGTNFMQSNLEPALAQFQQGFFTEKGQAWAEAHVEKLRDHMQKKTTGDMGRRAGNAIAADAVQVGNAFANTVRIDPSHDNVKLAIDGIDSGVGQVIKNHPGMDEGTRKNTHQTLTSKIKDDVLDTAAVAEIYKSGNFPSWMDPNSKDYEPEWVKHIDSKKLLALQKQQEAVKNHNEVEDRQLKAAMKADDDNEVRSLNSQNLAKSTKIDPATGQTSLAPDYLTNSLKILQDHPTPAAAEQYKAALDYSKKILAEEDKIPSNKQVLAGLNARAFDPQNPTTELDVLRAVNSNKPEGHISHQDAQPLLAMVGKIQEQGMRGPNFTTAMAAAQEKLGVNVMPDGHTRFSNFTNDFVNAYQSEIRAGKNPVDLLNTKDPNSLISKTLAPYAPDAQTLFSARLFKGIGLDPTGAASAQAVAQYANLPAEKRPIAATSATMANPDKTKIYASSGGFGRYLGPGPDGAGRWQTVHWDVQKKSWVDDEEK
jgi:hypothetical protein